MIRNIFTALLLLAFSINVSAQGYKYKFKVDGVSDTVIYLAKYYGKKQYYEDTAKVDSKGNFVFEGTEMLPGGIYLMVMPDKASYFEFLVSGDEKEFEISNKLGNFLETSEVKGSPENEAFYEYQRFISDKGMTAEKVNNKKKAEEEAENTKEVEKLQAELNAINEEVKSFKKEFMAKYPNKLITKIILASDDPVIPEDLKPIGEESMDQAKLRFYKSEYLKNMDFADDRLLRSPIFHRKLDYYMTKLVVQIPDSIIKEADQLVARTEGNKETFKYVVHYITNSYEKSKIMGMDAIFVHMAEQYYMTGQAHWMDSTKTAKVAERAIAMKPLLMGNIAPNIILPDTSGETGEWINLHKLPSKFTILYFWDSGCGHCKKATPKLREWYNTLDKSRGIEVFAVGTELENGAWKKFIQEKQLNWLNVSDTPEINKNAANYISRTTLASLNFRNTYDIYSTPVVYVLDHNKEIIAKKLGVEQIGDFLDRYEKEAAKMAAEQNQ